MEMMCLKVGCLYGWTRVSNGCRDRGHLSPKLDAYLSKEGIMQYFSCNIHYPVFFM